MKIYNIVTLFVFNCFLFSGCASLEKAVAPIPGSNATGLASCPKHYCFSENNEGVFFFSVVDNMLVKAELHWEILNIDTCQKFAFVLRGEAGWNFSGKSNCSYAVPEGKYELVKLYIRDTHGLKPVERVYLQFYEFEIEPSKVTYLGHIELNDPDNPKEDVSHNRFKQAWKKLGAMATGAHIPREIQLEVTDNYASDIRWFQERYACLRDSNYVIHLLKADSSGRP